MSATRRGGRRWKITRDAAFRRDYKLRAVCWICGQPINYEAPSSAPDGWAPDHYRPVSKFPELEFDLSNIRPSHVQCNLSRGAGDGIDHIGSTSRVW